MAIASIITASPSMIPAIATLTISLEYLRAPLLEILFAKYKGKFKSDYIFCTLAKVKIEVFLKKRKQKNNANYIYGHS
jgi:hypothetical protein